MTTETIEPTAAFDARGAKAAVFKPRFGQAHQQYFTPRWLCDANLEIATKLFGVAENVPLRVLDPTCGSGRLLAPFAAAGHQTIGIELDDRLVPSARRALGKHAVRQGDICLYAPYVAANQFDIAVINPPYGLWWEVQDTPLAQYELCPPASSEYGGSIESQNMVLELVTNSLYQNYYNGGLLIAVMSGKFWDVYPKAYDYLMQNYQVIANLILPQLFKPEYGIEVDASLIVANRLNPYSQYKTRVPWVGTFEGDNPHDLANRVHQAFRQITGYLSHYYAAAHYLPRIRPDDHPLKLPDLEMTVAITDTTTRAELTSHGLKTEGDWAQAWLKHLSGVPIETYNHAIGANTNVIDAIASIPNLLIAGADASATHIQELGFTVTLSDHHRRALDLAAQKYRRERLPLQQLSPMEYLAWYPDGPITAKTTATAPGVTFIEGITYDLAVRWERKTEVAKREDVGQGADAYTLKTHIDRGYLVFKFVAGENTQTITEQNALGIKAIIDAFGLPEVKTVADLPECERRSWAIQLGRLIENHAARNGNLRPNPTQENDILAFATKSRAGNLYEQGGGKTMTTAFWAELRGYKRVLIVTPASVVPGLIEDLQKWGFYALLSPSPSPGEGAGG